MQQEIVRVPGSSPKRTLASAFGPVAYAVATAGDATLDLAAQARRCFEKLEAALTEMGTAKDRLLSVTVYMANLEEKAIFDREWVAWISDEPSAWPQRSCIGVTLAKGTLVEIVVAAAR